MTRSRIPILLLLVLSALWTSPVGAAAATPAQDFMGMNSAGLTFDDGPKLNSGLKTMRKRGVGSMRIPFYYAIVQPYARLSDVPADDRRRFVDINGRPTDFGPTDAVVGGAAKLGITLLPVVIGTPSWNSRDPSNGFAPPTDVGEFGRFAAALAGRYGPKGSFWRENPSIQQIPIRAWQIWNEPAGFQGFGDPTIFWDTRYDTALATYRSMLKASRTELRRVDPRAQIVLSGFFGRSWQTMAQLYNAGYRKLFDVVAIHPYAASVSDELKLLRLVRKVMVRNGDTKKPMVLTEFGWSSSMGRLTDNVGLGYVQKTEQGQARILRQVYRTLWAKRSELRLRAAYWFTWATGDRPESKDSFDFLGLYRLANDGSITAKPAARAYQQVAAELRRAR